MIRVVDAAIKIDSDIFTGRTHSICFGKIANKYYPEWQSDKEDNERRIYFLNKVIQGFITNDNGRFVSRKEASEIAFKSGQIKKKKEELFSEDLFL